MVPVAKTQEDRCSVSSLSRAAESGWRRSIKAGVAHGSVARGSWLVAPTQ